MTTPYPPPPWHLVDLWFDFAFESKVIEKLSVPITIEGDVPDDVNLYLAPIGSGEINGQLFYGGLQTNSDGKTDDDRSLRVIGRGLIFSRWGERSLDAVRVAEVDGFWESSGHEGDFISVRRRHRWTPGRHRFELTAVEAEKRRLRRHLWVEAAVTSEATGERTVIGALRFPGDEMRLGRNLAWFAEIYGETIPVERIPTVVVRAHTPEIDGAPAPVRQVTAIYPEAVPDRAVASWHDPSQSVVVTLGPPVERDLRRVVLWPRS